MIYFSRKTKFQKVLDNFIGWTLGVAFILFVCFMIYMMWENPDLAYSETTFGYHGLTETRCQSGFKIVVGPQGFVQQLVDEQGRGIKCH